MRTYKTPKAILKHAAAIIEKRGWCQGAYQMKDGRVCAAGAIGIAANGVVCKFNDGYYRAERVFEKAVGMPPEMWNDAPGRRKFAVVRALLRASELA